MSFEEKTIFFEKHSHCTIHNPTTDLYIIELIHPNKSQEFIGYILEETQYAVDIIIRGNDEFLSMILDGNTFTALVEDYWKCWGK
jgi:hypothetical protein